MRLSTRWQDWVALLAGIYAALSPLWSQTEATATWTMVTLGVVLAAAAAWSILAPGVVVSEWTHVGLGLLLVVSPFVMGFNDLMGLAWTAWVTGIVAIGTGLLALPASRAEHDRLALGH